MKDEKALLRALTIHFQRLAVNRTEHGILFNAAEELARVGGDDFEAWDNAQGFRSRTGERVEDWLTRQKEQRSWLFHGSEADAPATPKVDLSKLTPSQKLDYSNGARITAKGIGDDDA